jgi:hypothetical protein
MALKIGRSWLLKYATRWRTVPFLQHAINEDIACSLCSDRLILLYAQLRSKKSARKRCVQNVRNWLFANHPGAISEEETGFILHDEDLIPSVSKDQSKTRELFEDWMIMRTKLLLPLFRQRTHQNLGNVNRETLYYTSDKHIGVFSSIAIFVAGVVMFVAPLWILQALDDFRQRLGVITVFIIVFLSVLASSTLGKPFEMLAATAG